MLVRHREFGEANLRRARNPINSLRGNERRSPRGNDWRAVPDAHGAAWARFHDDSLRATVVTPGSVESAPAAYPEQGDQRRARCVAIQVTHGHLANRGDHWPAAA